MANEWNKKIDDLQEKVDEVSKTINKLDTSLAVRDAIFKEHTKQDEQILSKIDAVETLTGNIASEITVQKNNFEAHIKADEMIFKKMYEELKRMNDILATNTASLAEHMRRTATLEEAVAKIDMRLSPIEVERIQKDAISKDRKELIILLVKIIGGIATLIGAVIAAKPFIIKLLTLL